MELNQINKKYFGRVVVLFDDNEKIVELVANPSDVVSLKHTDFPVVKFVAEDGTIGALTHEYDSISGYVMVEDTSEDMLLSHVDGTWPLVVSVTAQTGKVHTIKLSEGLTGPGGQIAGEGTNIQYFRFELTGLARDTTHTVSVSGYLNERKDKNGFN